MHVRKYIKLLSTPKAFLNQLWIVVMVNVLNVGRLFLSDNIYLRIKYRYKVGKGKIDFDHPVTYNEKMQWIKMHDRKEVYHRMVDKIEAKAFISETVGADYVVPTICTWNAPEDISLDQLPDKFILKNTFDSGTYSICSDKKTFSIENAIQKLNSTRGKDYYLYSREWPYKGLSQRVIAEPLLSNSNGFPLVDYKFMTCSGVPRLLFILSERDKRDHAYQNIFDMDGNPVPYGQYGYESNPNVPALPQNFALMQQLARKLSENTYCLRVDFYEVDGKPYVGELTFFDNGGFSKFTDSTIDNLWGSWINLPH